MLRRVWTAIYIITNRSHLQNPGQMKSYIHKNLVKNVMKVLLATKLEVPDPT
jgi:hypothetical protein